MGLQSTQTQALEKNQVTLKGKSVGFTNCVGKLTK